MKRVREIHFQIFIVLILFFTLSLPAKSQILTDSSYFPMHIGNQWTLQSGTPNGFQIETIVDTQRIEGNLYFRFDQFRDNSQAFLRRIENQVFRYADTSEVLWYDFSVDTGASWKVPTPEGGSEWTVYLLSETDTIESPAGVFTNCYHFYFSGIQDYEWEEWFAPGIGIVERRLHGFAFVDWQLNEVIITSLNEPKSNVIRSICLYQNYPNPFNPSTTIKYDLPQKSNVTSRIYNTLGQEIAILVNEQQTVGEKSVVWDGRDKFGNQVSSGVYFYKLEDSNYVKGRKMVLLK